MTVAYETDWCHGYGSEWNHGNIIKDTESKIELTIGEAEYALKCIRYLASGFDFDLSEKDIQKMRDFADKIYRRVESVKQK